MALGSEPLVCISVHHSGFLCCSPVPSRLATYSTPCRKAEPHSVIWEFLSDSQQPCEIGHPNRLQVRDCLTDLAAQRRIRICTSEALELLDHGFPPHGARVKPFII